MSLLETQRLSAESITVGLCWGGGGGGGDGGSSGGGDGGGCGGGGGGGRGVFLRKSIEVRSA